MTLILPLLGLCIVIWSPMAETRGGQTTAAIVGGLMMFLGGFWIGS